MRRQWRWRVEGRAAAVHAVTELVPALLWIFEWLFCNFKIV